MNLLNRVVLAFLFSIVAVAVHAQVSLKELIDDYVEVKMQGQDATSALSRLNMAYKQRNKKEQTVFKETIYNSIYEHQEAGRNVESLSLIDLYQFFAEPSDKHLPLLYYIKGEIAAQDYSDSIALKNSIRDLQMLNPAKGSKVADYIATLTGYLSELRSYVPVLERLDGIWMPINTVFSYRAGIMPIFTMSAIWSAFSYPNYILYFEHGAPEGSKIKLLGAYGVSLHNGSSNAEYGVYAQNIQDLRKDRLYAEWGSERLKKIDPSLQSALLQSTSRMTDNIASQIFDVNSVFGSLGGDLLNAGVGSMISSLMSPKKRITVVQCELQKINDYEMLGVFHNQIAIVNASGEPDIETISETVYFTKWERDDKLFFIGEGNSNKNSSKYSFYLDEFDKDNTFTFYKDCNKQTEAYGYDKYSKLIKKSRGMTDLNQMEHVRGNISFNNMQIMKQFLKNEQIMTREGIAMLPAYHSAYNHTYLGCAFSDLSEHADKASGGKGVYIAGVEDYSPAFLFGVKAGDILLSIDGFALKTPAQAVDFIISQRPFTEVTLEIIRKGKVKKIPVELSYKIVTE